MFFSSWTNVKQTFRDENLFFVFFIAQRFSYSIYGKNTVHFFQSDIISWITFQVFSAWMRISFLSPSSPIFCCYKYKWCWLHFRASIFDRQSTQQAKTSRTPPKIDESDFRVYTSNHQSSVIGELMHTATGLEEKTAQGKTCFYFASRPRAYI